LEIVFSLVDETANPNGTANTGHCTIFKNLYGMAHESIFFAVGLPFGAHNSRGSTLFYGPIVFTAST